MSQDKERRQHQRFDVAFKITVSGMSNHESPFKETVQLNNISDVGLSFISHYPWHYYVTQAVSISLKDQSISQMEGRVVWVHWNNFPEGDTINVGIALDESINTEKIIL